MPYRCVDALGSFRLDDPENELGARPSVNEYLRAIAGDDFSSKDFRTWVGTVLAARILVELHGAEPAAPLQAIIHRAIESVARKLGNTKAVCRKCYIHPAIIEAYSDGSLVKISRLRLRNVKAGAPGALKREEGAVVAVLRRGAKRRARPNHRASLRKQLRKSLRRAKRPSR